MLEPIGFLPETLDRQCEGERGAREESRSFLLNKLDKMELLLS